MRTRIHCFIPGHEEGQCKEEEEEAHTQDTGGRTHHTCHKGKDTEGHVTRIQRVTQMEGHMHYPEAMEDT